MSESLSSKGRAVTVLRRKIAISFYYVVAYGLVLYGYYKFIVPMFGYSGFRWEPDYFKIIEGITLVVFISLMLPSQFNKPSDILLHLQFLFPIVPMVVLYGAESFPQTYLYFSICSYLVILLVVLITSKFRIKVLRVTKLTPVMFQRFLLITGWAVIASIIAFGGYRYLNFDLSKVYELRSDAANNLPGIYGYLSPLVSKVILPFSLLLGVIKKEKLTIILSILGSIMMFALTSHKGPLFAPFAVLILYLVLNRQMVVQVLLLGYICVICISVASFATNGIWIGTLLLRRTLLVPAQLNNIYYDFFSNNPFMYWSQSKLTLGVLEQPYNIDSSHLIGSEYFGSTAIGANTGWLGSGYMNAGFLGMLVYAIIIGILFVILNEYSKYLDKKIIVAITFVPIFSLMISSDLPPSFLNHGILLVLGLLAMSSFKNPAHKDLPKGQYK